jgi:hypothetical protein
MASIKYDSWKELNFKYINTFHCIRMEVLRKNKGESQESRQRDQNVNLVAPKYITVMPAWLVSNCISLLKQIITYLLLTYRCFKNITFTGSNNRIFDEQWMKLEVVAVFELQSRHFLEVSRETIKTLDS